MQNNKTQHYGRIMMNFKEYQEAQQSTAVYNSVMYPFGSIAEEAGEVMGKINKYVRKEDVDYEDAILGSAEPMDTVSENLRYGLLQELGDVLWQVSACASELNIDLETIAELNLNKTTGRAVRGTLNGEGDDR